LYKESLQSIDMAAQEYLNTFSSMQSSLR